MAETNIWVHGVAFEANFPADFIESNSISPQPHFVDRGGASGIVFRSVSPSPQVFHVSIPSPTILNEFRMRLAKVYVFYQTIGATIKSVSVYDGQKLVRVFDKLNWSGNHSGSIDDSNRLIFSPSLEIFNGIGIFVEVEFSAPTQPPGTIPEVRFATAGVQLYTGERLITSIILRMASMLEGPLPDR